MIVIVTLLIRIFSDVKRSHGFQPLSTAAIHSRSNGPRNKTRQLKIIMNLIMLKEHQKSPCLLSNGSKTPFPLCLKYSVHVSSAQAFSASSLDSGNSRLDFCCFPRHSARRRHRTHHSSYRMSRKIVFPFISKHESLVKFLPM